jgi:hypothetical protein
MTVKKKAIRPANTQESDSISEEEIERVIQRGGTTTAENQQTLKAKKTEKVPFLLRLSTDLIEQVDRARKSRPGNISRNQWITEMLVEMLNQHS